MKKATSHRVEGSITCQPCAPDKRDKDKKIKHSGVLLVSFVLQTREIMIRRYNSVEY